MAIKPVFYRSGVGNDIWKPRHVLLFSGHMIDAPSRIKPRFPAEYEPIAAQKITATLEQISAGFLDLGMTQGACGGDLLFSEACLQRGVKLQLLQPFDEATFIKESVIPVDANWLQRYQRITNKLEIPPSAAPQALGVLPSTMNAYERCNLWLLASALAYGSEKLIFICLWDGNDVDEPGGTAHMVREVEKQNGQVIWLNTKQLW
ncbi:MAG: hypothetical protein WAW41_14920 [Methylobacter sp.]